MTRLSLRALIACAALALCSCLIPQIERYEYTDRGEACLVHTGTDTVDEPIEPGDDLEIIVFFPHGCLSSSCSDVRTTTCTATLVGDEIRVTSHGVVEEDVSARECTADCGIMAARCFIEIETAGEYTIVHGEETRAVTIPGQPQCSAGL